MQATLFASALKPLLRSICLTKSAFRSQRLETSAHVCNSDEIQAYTYEALRPASRNITKVHQLVHLEKSSLQHGISCHAEHGAVAAAASSDSSSSLNNACYTSKSPPSTAPLKSTPNIDCPSSSISRRSRPASPGGVAHRVVISNSTTTGGEGCGTENYPEEGERE
ncbi:hypothetical protein M378DRAFT_811545 [Amanita muscaria Koide BX008]|uniref:Uncharacterized protein n=1 Tax=Amanita muscaria (strain Koide BX008) TaxID=946122 RepID=A0A0C2SFY2_AMAMK|nr:hypothetical protein M378DRAFT_811545 [Amanita muscaria Koide BX008]